MCAMLAPTPGCVRGAIKAAEAIRNCASPSEGTLYLRRLLVSAAQYILGPFGPKSALRDYGLMLAADGTTRAKKRAVVAVARKLCVLLLSLWKNQTAYQPYPANH